MITKFWETSSKNLKLPEISYQILGWDFANNGTIFLSFYMCIVVVDSIEALLLLEKRFKRTNVYPISEARFTNTATHGHLLAKTLAKTESWLLTTGLDT